MPQRRKSGRVGKSRPMERAQEKMDAFKGSKTVKERIRKKSAQEKRRKGLERHHRQNPFAKIEVEI